MNPCNPTPSSHCKFLTTPLTAGFLITAPPPALLQRAGRLGIPMQSTQSGALHQNKTSIEPDQTQHHHPKKLKITPSSTDHSRSTSTRSIYAEETARFVQRVIVAIQKNSLLKTGQQLRDDEVQRSLDDALPQVLIDLVRDYIAPELCLHPLSLSPLGDVLDSAVNTPIRRAISSAFSADGINSELFRTNIIKNHQHNVLHQIFSDDLALIRATATLDAIRSGDKQALQTRKEQIAAIVNYLPDSRIQITIQHKLAQLKRLRPSKFSEVSLDKARLESIGRLDIDVQLLLHCAGNSDPTLRALRQVFELRKYRLDQLNVKINAAIAKRDYISAQRRFMQAFEVYCDEGNKRGAIKLAIQFIDLSRYRKTDNFQEILQLFEPIKALCLSYPSDTDLYAELLFKIDDFARERSEFSVATNLYRQAHAVFRSDLPVRYKAKIIYRCTFLSWAVAPHAFKTFEHVLSAINDFRGSLQDPQYDPLRYDHTRTVLTEPKDSKFKDVGIGEFLRCFSSLHHIAARMINDQINSFPTLSPERRARLFELVLAINLNTDNELDYEITHEQFLPLKHTGSRLSPGLPDEMVRQQLVVATADCYKRALKIIFDDRYDEAHAAEGSSAPFRYTRWLNPSNVPFCISIMEELAQLYLSHGLYGELNKLMGNRFQSAMARELPGINEKFRSWHKSLRDSDKAQNQHLESDKKYPARKK